nr:PD-(D/E)XK motif protein [Streptomyces spiramenti]
MLADHWSALEAERVSEARRLRVAELTVVSDRGPLAAAVDHEGNRHLLVPVPTHAKVRTGLDGPVLRLRKRPLEDEDTYQHYVDLTCLRNDLHDLFTELCADVLGEVERASAHPVRALYEVLDRWKALFLARAAPLGAEQLAGLFGELTLLGRLLASDPSAHRIWRGPSGHRHDFSTDVTAVEVKSSTAAQGRRPRVHGLDQLEPPEGGTLCLAWFRLRRTGANGPGTAFPELVDRARRLCDDEYLLLTLLAAAGYRPSDADLYRDVRFQVIEERWYRVDAGFPSLTGRALVAAGVPVPVLDVEYTVDLSGQIPPALSADDTSRVIDRMIKE